MWVAFSEFLLDREARQLWRRGAEIHLQPRTFRLLEILLDARPKALSKTELMELIWPDVIVEQGNLKTMVSELREALGDTANPRRFIRTVHRYGYAFCGDGENVSNPTVPSHRYELEAGGVRYPIAEGVNEIGRHPTCRVRIDSLEISRHHARIVIRDGTVILSDLGSKNGTWIAGKRLSQERELHDGDRFELGAISLTFRIRQPDEPTRTGSHRPIAL